MEKVNRVTKVQGPLPGPRSAEWLRRWEQAEAQCTGYQARIVWDHAAGVQVTDVDGNVFLDWTSGVLVTNAGHCHPQLVEAVQRAASRLLNNYECPTPERIQAAEKLISILPPHLNRCFFLSTGSEAIEAALRIMKRQSGRFEIISFHGAFHGRTPGAASSGGLTGPKKGYGPSLPGAIRAPYPYCYRCPFKARPESCGLMCLEFLDDLVKANSTDSLAGVLVEPYQGAAGFIFPPDGWLRQLEQWARQHQLLFTLDEVQSSFGRTGKNFAMELENLTPDLVCMGKGLGGGPPVSALAARAEVISVLARGELSSTMGGNPLSSAAVITMVEILQKEQLAENSRKIGELMIARLREIQEHNPYVGDVRGKGLVMGVELVRDKATREPAPDMARRMIDLSAEEGLLIGTVGIWGNVIRVAPPLVITEAEAEESLDLFEAALARL
jgi:4-aminobutyrate aminotransferase